MEKKDFQSLASAKEELQAYHGATKLQNIPEFTSSELYQSLTMGISVSLDQTVSQVLARINDALSEKSIFSQLLRFQKARDDKLIDLWTQRLYENRRKELYKSYDLYELLQIAFSPSIYYFKIPSEAFKKFKGKERELYANAIDVMIIDPSQVPQSSLDTLGIKQLDPDCQNLKEIFKKMVSLSYTAGDKKKYTPTINTYGGKFITFSSQSVVYPATQPATQGEKRKQDISTQMAVYPDLFSMIRREWHILEAIEEKKSDYQKLKTELIVMLNEIPWNDKSYGASIPGKVRNIIKEIDGADNAKVVALKLYSLYRITWRNKGHDAKYIESAITKFSKRIGELVGISSHVQLHSLALEDELEDQQSDCEMFHAQARMSLSKPSQRQRENMLFVACETYYNNMKRYRNLKEPFFTFAKQIHQLCWKMLEDVPNNAAKILPKIWEIIDVQEKTLTWYLLEHQLNLEEKTIEEVADDLQGIQEWFRIDMTKRERDEFFDQLKNLSSLQRTVDEILHKG